MPLHGFRVSALGFRLQVHIVDRPCVDRPWACQKKGFKYFQIRTELSVNKAHDLLQLPL